VVGDRFVFQSEVLFPSGSDQLSPAGRDQITELAKTFEGIAKDIPSDVNWLLRVDGHADKQKVDPLGPFVDNWDLSAKRAIRVVQLLIEAGIPANRLAATAFGDNQPLDPADTPDAYRKNRRIEIRLTDR
jgi:chemotaxis protein MotB